MEKEKPRLARLTAILTQLQTQRIVTARSIAERHGVSIRTVYRDIRTLEQSGIPVFTEEGKGYSLMEGYTLPPVMFTEAEANTLITAERIVRQNKDKSLADNCKSAVDKVKAVLRHGQKDKTEFLDERLEIRSSGAKEASSDFLIRLQSALTNYQLVAIDYYSLQNERTQRKVEPFALIHTQDNWLLIGYCRLRNAFRAFRLDCILQLTITSTVFEPHKLTLQEYFDSIPKQW